MRDIMIDELKAKKDRDYITIMGGAIFLLKTKIRNKHKIVLSDFKELTTNLGRLDKHNLEIWRKLNPQS